MHNFIESPICMGSERVQDPHHPTQKPLKVLRHIIQIASNPGDMVFDPFMGVGSTGVAAVELGRRFLGVEIDERYFVAAERRLQAIRS
jgi:site-specific DNA-methyltransferase (adenine-specific)/modification methylase